MGTIDPVLLTHTPDANSAKDLISKHGDMYRGQLIGAEALDRLPGRPSDAAAAEAWDAALAAAAASLREGELLPGGVLYRALIGEQPTGRMTQGQVLTYSLSLGLTLIASAIAALNGPAWAFGLLFAAAVAATAAMVQADLLAGESFSQWSRSAVVIASSVILACGLATNDTALSAIGSLLFGVAMASVVSAFRHRPFWTHAEVPNRVGRALAWMNATGIAIGAFVLLGLAVRFADAIGL